MVHFTPVDPCFPGPLKSAVHYFNSGRPIHMKPNILMNLSKTRLNLDLLGAGSRAEYASG